MCETKMSSDIGDMWWLLFDLCCCFHLHWQWQSWVTVESVTQGVQVYWYCSTNLVQLSQHRLSENRKVACLTCNSFKNLCRKRVWIDCRRKRRLQVCVAGRWEDSTWCLPKAVRLSVGETPQKNAHTACTATVRWERRKKHVDLVDISSETSTRWIL